MVVDACHSAAAVEAEGSSRARWAILDWGSSRMTKGCRFWWRPRPLPVHGQRGQPSDAGPGRRGDWGEALELTEALRYAEQRVPKLYEEKTGKERPNN